MGEGAPMVAKCTLICRLWATGFYTVTHLW